MRLLIYLFALVTGVSAVDATRAAEPSRAEQARVIEAAAVLVQRADISVRAGALPRQHVRAAGNAPYMIGAIVPPVTDTPVSRHDISLQ